MIRPGLERISKLLARTPLTWPAIHVAGTNGKGSICAYITAMLSVYNQSSYIQRAHLPKIRHGRFTSPHLIDRWDCISINGEAVDGDVFKAVEAEVLRRDRGEGIGASEFEILTASAFEIFNREKVDVGVVEVGMGGAEDATNVIGVPVSEGRNESNEARITRPLPLATVISKIGLDHQGFLGNTLAEIAKQKAGIIKPRVPVILDPTNTREAQDVITSEAKAKNSLVYTDGHFPWLVPRHLAGQYEPRDRGPMLHRIPERFAQAGQRPPPQHVIGNATLAMLAVQTTLQQLNCLPMSTSALTATDHGRSEESVLLSCLNTLEKQMLHSVATTVFPGRQQSLNIESLTGRKNRILLDGAHNADSAKVLAERVERIRLNTSGWPVIWVLAASDSKDAAEIFRPLLQPGDKVVLVEFGPVDGMPWVKPMAVEKLEEAVMRASETSSGIDSVQVVTGGKDISLALREATNLAQDSGRELPMVVAGSLYLVGDVLRLLREAGSHASEE